VRRLWEILPLVLIGLFLFLAAYLLFAPGPWSVSYPVRILVGGVLLVYAGTRGFFWYKRWKKGDLEGYKQMEQL